MLIYGLYIKYEKSKTNYKKILDYYDSLITEKEYLFMSTQPKSTKYDKVYVEGGNKSNSFDDYLVQVEKKQLDLKLEEAKKLVDIRNQQLKATEKELRSSKEWSDIIYVYKYLDKIPVKKIIHLVPYSEAQIYRFIKEIDKNIGELKK